MRQEKSSLLRNKGFQSLLASLLCIVLGLLIGYIVLLIINPAGAGEAIRTIVENFLYYPSAAARLRYLGNTLVKTAPLLMCSLSVLFAYKVGLFNIGAAGQYVIGAGASLYCALGFGLPWYVCLLAAIAAGAVLGAISGLLKAYRNVNEVISCIMLNWISLYLVNALLSQVKETASPYTFTLSSTNPDAILPSLGLGALFSDNQYVTIAIPLTVIVAVGIWVLLGHRLQQVCGQVLRHEGEAKHHPHHGHRRRPCRHGRGHAVPHRIRAVAGHTVRGAGHGLQRHRRRLPGRTESHRRYLLLVFHSAHHQRRRVCGQDHVLRPDL